MGGNDRAGEGMRGGEARVLLTLLSSQLDTSYSESWGNAAFRTQCPCNVEHSRGKGRSGAEGKEAEINP